MNSVLEAFLSVISLLNLVILVRVSQKVSLLEKEEKEKPVTVDESNIQTVLNSRLLELQNQRYSVGQRRL